MLYKLNVVWVALDCVEFSSSDGYKGERILTTEAFLR